MKRSPAGPVRRLAACYALAAALWLLRCLVCGGIMLNAKLGGRMPSLTLHEQDLVLQSLVRDPAPERAGWYVSSDSDPHILWQGEGYIESVTLHAVYAWPPGEIALYYLRPGQTEYSEAQKSLAHCTAPGTYTFALGGRVVAGLRIDPDSRGGIPIRLDDLQLNPAAPWYSRFVPTGGWWTVLLFAPPAALAVLAALARALKALRRAKA